MEKNTNRNVDSKLNSMNSLHPNYSLRELNPGRLEAILNYAGQEILDVGCGSGAYVLHLSDRYNIRGVDYKKFDSWQASPELFSIADAQVLANDNNSVDTILSFETLEHLANPQLALSEYFRVCKKNLIITVPNCRLTIGMKNSGIIYNHWIDRTHINFWDMETITKLLSDAGFTVQHSQSINEINLGAVIMEALGFGGIFARIGARIFRLCQRKRYFMTNLIIARKTT